MSLDTSQPNPCPLTMEQAFEKQRLLQEWKKASSKSQEDLFEKFIDLYFQQQTVFKQVLSQGISP